MKSNVLLSLLGATLLLLIGCGGGGGGSSGSGASVSLLVGDGPTDELSAFEMTLLDVTLTRDDGSTTANLLASPRSVDLLALRVESALLAVVTVPPGSFAGATLTFDPATIVARDRSGAPVKLQVNGNLASGLFALPVAFERDDRVKLHFEFPLDDSLSPDGSGGFVFTPELRPSRREGSDDALDEMHGGLLSADAARGLLVVNLLDDDDSSSRGALTIAIDPATHLLDDHGNPFASSADLFAFLLPGDRIEASGGLGDDGLLHAAVLQVERDDHGASIARIRGTITALDLEGATLTLRLRSVESGAPVVGPVLAALGDPAEITVGFSAAEIELRGDDPRNGSSADLAVGQEVKIDFSAFASAPFPARSIEIEDEQPEIEATIVGTGGLPAEFVVHLDESDPAILDGRVASTSTDVVVLLDGTETIRLDLSHAPSIAAGSLQTGLSVRVRGVLSGTPDLPDVTASDLRVKPGRLRGVVAATDPAGFALTVAVDSFDDPFGGPSLDSPVAARFADGAQVGGDATSIAAFFDLFAGLNEGESLEVDLFGIADGLGGAIAHEIDVRVRH
jgi:uncharacterized protein DUF4382